MDNCIASYQQLLKVQEREQYDLETRIKCYEEERMEFEKERAGWKEELDQARQEIIEQNDRLTVLSEQLAGRKVCVCVCLFVCHRLATNVFIGKLLVTGLG